MLGKYNRRTVAAASGEIVPNATVNFYWQQTGLPATVYADPEGDTPLGGSVLSDESGAIGVFLQPGRYRVVVTLGGDILEEVTWEPVVNELATAQSTDFVIKLAEMTSPSETSYLRTLSSGFSEHRTIAQVRTDLSINNVNNTSDANKPISAATLAALNGKINATEKGANNGVATLNAIGLIPPEQLPSYVDDVIERANYAALPATGETGKIYITTDNNKQYRWGGSTYIELVSSPGSTDALAEGSTNKYFTEARVRATVLTGYTAGSNTTLASTDTILAALGKVQGQLNAKATSAQGTKADTALQPGANVSQLTNNVGYINQTTGDARYVQTTGDQSIGGVKTFSNTPSVPGLNSSSSITITNSLEAPFRHVRGAFTSDFYCGGTGRATLFSTNGTGPQDRAVGVTPNAAAPDFYDGAAWRNIWHEGNDSVLAKTNTEQTITGKKFLSTGIGRTAHNVGHLEGGRDNIGSSIASATNPIFTIGSNYNPGGTVLNGMYGIGFTTDAASFMPAGITSTGWSLYIASAGTVRVNLNGTDGTIRSTGGHYVNGNEVYHAGNLSATLVGYLTGLTSNVQAQLDAKASATVDQNVRNASYTLAITDNGKHLYHSNSTAYTWTIPPNSSVAFPVGATVTFVNDGSGNITIALGSGVTVVMAGSGLTGNRTLAQFGMVTALKVATDRWLLSGTGVS